jgi:hypothetical protein
VLPSLPSPVDPDAIEEGDGNKPGDLPVGELKAELVQMTKAGGTVTSAIEKPEKSKGVLKESIVTRDAKKNSYAARSFRVLSDRIQCVTTSHLQCQPQSQGE